VLRSSTHSKMALRPWSSKCSVPSSLKLHQIAIGHLSRTSGNSTQKRTESLPIKPCSCAFEATCP
jgi:hypothetical protein